MSSFTEPLSITQVSVKPRRWRLDKSFRFHVGDENSKTWVDVLEGFECDGGSLPRAVWWLESPIGQGASAFFLHDVLYQSEAAPRKQCDMMMLEGLQVLKFGWTRRTIIYHQVRLWGGFVWDGHTRESIINGRRFIRTSWELPPLPEPPPPPTDPLMGV